jgi:hypothetical protein
MYTLIYDIPFEIFITLSSIMWNILHMQTGYEEYFA